MSEESLPVTFMQRFSNLHYENKSVILIVVNSKKASIYCEANAEIIPVVFEDSGNGIGADKMKNYDFSGMKVCNTQVAKNGRFFAIGLVKEMDAGEKKSRSLFGIFKID